MRCNLIRVSQFGAVNETPCDTLRECTQLSLQIYAFKFKVHQEASRNDNKTQL